MEWMDAARILILIHIINLHCFFRVRKSKSWNSSVHCASVRSEIVLNSQSLIKNRGSYNLSRDNDGENCYCSKDTGTKLPKVHPLLSRSVFSSWKVIKWYMVNLTFRPEPCIKLLTSIIFEKTFLCTVQWWWSKSQTQFPQNLPKLHQGSNRIPVSQNVW